MGKRKYRSCQVEGTPAPLPHSPPPPALVPSQAAGVGVLPPKRQQEQPGLWWGAPCCWGACARIWERGRNQGLPERACSKGFAAAFSCIHFLYFLALGGNCCFSRCKSCLLSEFSFSGRKPVFIFHLGFDEAHSGKYTAELG